jgi:branched-chain amino acid transport system substrate-binding protein
MSSVTLDRCNYSCISSDCTAVVQVACRLSFGPPKTPGATATYLMIGNTAAYGGPASAYGIIARTEEAVFKMINDRGGVSGRRIVYDSLDDGYSPPKTVDQVRRLVEQDQVALMFATIGTPSNTAIYRYTNSRGVPLLFLGSGANKWGDPRNAPWVMGFQPSYRTEAQIYTRYIQREKPDAKIGILYQNDDFGKDYPAGVRDVLGSDFDSKVIKAVSYETTDATIDSQAVALQGSGAGPENARGMISAAYLKDPTDPTWKDDPGMGQWRAFMAKYMPDADLTDTGPVFGYAVTACLWQVLKQCGTNFTRANIMKQAAALHDLEIPVLLPGIKVNTSATNFHPIGRMQLTRWTGEHFELFGKVLEGEAT